MIDPQMIMQLKEMVHKGAQAKDIIFTLKSKGLTPESAEEVLCEVFPEIKRAKQAIANSGMSTKQYLSQLTKQNNIPTDQLSGMMNDFKKILG